MSDYPNLEHMSNADLVQMAQACMADSTDADFVHAIAKEIARRKPDAKPHTPFAASNAADHPSP